MAFDIPIQWLALSGRQGVCTAIEYHDVPQDIHVVQRFQSCTSRSSFTKGIRFDELEFEFYSCTITVQSQRKPNAELQVTLVLYTDPEHHPLLADCSCIICKAHPHGQQRQSQAPTCLRLLAASPCCKAAPLVSRWHTQHWVLYHVSTYFGAHD